MRARRVPKVHCVPLCAVASQSTCDSPLLCLGLDGQRQHRTWEVPVILGTKTHKTAQRTHEKRRALPRQVYKFTTRSMDNGRPHLRMTHHTHVTQKTRVAAAHQSLVSTLHVAESTATSTCVCFTAHQRWPLNNSTCVSRVAPLKPWGNGTTTILHCQRSLFWCASLIHLCFTRHQKKRTHPSHPDCRTYKKTL